MSLKQQKLDGHTEEPVPERIEFPLGKGIVNAAINEASDEVDTDSSRDHGEARADTTKGKIAEIVCRQLFDVTDHDSWEADLTGPRGGTTVEVKTWEISPDEVNEGRPLVVRDRHQKRLFADYYLLTYVVTRKGQRTRDGTVIIEGFVPAKTIKKKAEYHRNRYEYPAWQLAPTHLHKPDPEFFPPISPGGYRD